MSVESHDSETESDAVLETFEAPESTGTQILTFETDEITAQCPFDFGGPDFYSFQLRYMPSDLCIESKSLKLYLQSFRNREITAEEFGAELYDTFTDLLDPDRMYIQLEQARRGGLEETVEMGDTSLV